MDKTTESKLSLLVGRDVEDKILIAFEERRKMLRGKQKISFGLMFCI